MSKELSDAQLINELGKLVAEQTARTSNHPPTGACIVDTATKTYCFNGYTQSQCNALGGIWTQGGTCP